MLHVIAIGNLTKDPESRVVKINENDVQIVNFTIAANYGFGDHKKTEFIRVSAWRGLGETCMRYLQKGNKVYVSGTPTVNTYINKNGNAVGNIELQLEEIEFLTNKHNDTTESAAEVTVDEELEELL